MALRVAKRFEDMSPDGTLVLLIQDDEDVIVQVNSGGDDRGESATVEFTTPFSGGGQSPKTHAALRALFVAMQEDEKERQQYRT